MSSYDEAPHEDVANDEFTTQQVEENNAPGEDVVDEGTGNPDQKLQGDDTEAIDRDNILKERTRNAKPSGGYREPGDNEGIPADA